MEHLWTAKNKGMEKKYMIVRGRYFMMESGYMI